MADISQIVLPDNTTVNIKDELARKQTGVYHVFGTQTESTNVWTGDLHGVSALYDGLTIAYVLPYAPTSNSATLELTLDDGTTTGAINVYLTPSSRFQNQISTGKPIMLSYYGVGKLINNGSPNTDNRWIKTAYYDTDIYAYANRIYSNNIYKVGSSGAVNKTIIMQIADGRYESIVTTYTTGRSKTANTHGFKLGTLFFGQSFSDNILAENTYFANGTLYDRYCMSVDSRYFFNTASNSTNGLIAGKPVYIVGSINSNDGLFYLNTTKWWTQDTPTTEDGNIYILCGIPYDYYRLYDVLREPKIYRYKNGVFREYLPGTEVQDALDDALARIAALEARLNS